MAPIILTPINPWARAQYPIAQLSVYNWFVGVHIYGAPGEYLVRGIRPGTFYTSFMVPYVEETLETLYEKNALLLVTGKDYSDTDPIDPLGRLSVEDQPTVVVELFKGAFPQGKQLLVTFDLKALRPNKVQLFYWYEFIGSFDVDGRCKRAVLFDTPAETLYISLRPASKELYIYSVQVDVL